MFTPVLPAADAPREAVITGYRSQMEAAADYIRGLHAVDPEKQDDGWRNDMRSATRFILEADPVLSAMERSAPAPERGPVGHTMPSNEGRTTLGAAFTERDEYRNGGPEGWASNGNVDMELRGSMFAHNQQFRISSADDSGGMWLPTGQPLAPRPRQMRLFLRDVLDVVETGLSTVPYIRELNAAALEYGASAVEEGSAKPEASLTWELDEAPVRKIAAWVQVTSEVIEDAPTLRGYIDGRLSYMLAVREEYEVLRGSGTAPHIKGILNYSGLQTHVGGSDPVAGVGYGIGLVENVDGEADAIVMNPLKYWGAITTRQSTQFDGSGTIGVGNNGAPFVAGPQGLWGLPVIRSRALSLNEALVGSFGLGATLFDRMSTRIVVGNQHSDYFTSNKVAVLAEERVGLAVHRPDFFVRVTFS
jgi:HK97 family phage major capsid protein